ncbi:MAG: hypothetical protein RJA99_3001 [Pseudomonadota bacterium]
MPDEIPIPLPPARRRKVAARLALAVITATVAGCGGGHDCGCAPPQPAPAGLEVLAGQPGGPGLLDGPGAQARFSGPTGLAVDGTGALWVADTGNLALRRISPDGTVTTVAGGPDAFDLATRSGLWLKLDRVAVATDGTPYALDTDYGRLFAVDPAAGTVRTLLGSPIPDRICQSGSCAAARTGFGLRLHDLAPDGAGRLVVPAHFAGAVPGNGGLYGPAERVQRHAIDTGAVETWLAGGPPPPVDGPVPAVATVLRPRAATVDAAGRLVLFDGYAVRRLSTAGWLETVAGVADAPGDADGTGAVARFADARAIAADAVGALWVLQVDGRLRRVSADGMVTTEAGASGTATADTLANAFGLAVDARGTRFVTDRDAHRVARLAADGTQTRVAGSPLPAQTGWVDAPRDAARFSNPVALALTPSGAAHVVDGENHLIRRVEADGTVTTLAGAARDAGSLDGPGAQARFRRPRSIAVDATGSSYVVDDTPCALRIVGTDGTVRTERRTDGGCFGDDAPAGDLFARAVAVEADGAVVVAYADRLARRDRLGRWTRIAQPGYVDHLAAGPAGTLVFAASFNGVVRRIERDGLVVDLAGTETAGLARPADGRGADARFGAIGGLAVDAAGRVLVSDTNRIRRIGIDRAVTTVLGRAGAVGVRAGGAAAASLNRPAGLAVSADGTLLGTDTAEHLVFRAVLPP